MFSSPNIIQAIKKREGQVIGMYGGGGGKRAKGVLGGKPGETSPTGKTKAEVGEFW